MLRMLNVMVDRYLELREPLSDRLDRWQRDLLDPRRPFWNWSALLEARMELRKLENLCEGQYDALTEMRDEYLEQTPEASVSDAYLVRLNDVMEHIQRVLHHARRLESSVESAVQLHFSANTHQTNEIVRKLTAIAAIFAPLTLISGIFGMNFRHMPLLDDLDGFWITAGAMAAVAAVMLLYFWTRRILERPRAPAHSRAGCADVPAGRCEPRRLLASTQSPQFPRVPLRRPPLDVERGFSGQRAAFRRLRHGAAGSRRSLRRGAARPAPARARSKVPARPRPSLRRRGGSAVRRPASRRAPA